MHGLIRPGREAVTAWYIVISLTALVFLSDELSAAIADIFTLESSLSRRFATFSVDVIAVVLLMRFLMGGVFFDDDHDEDRRLTRRFSLLLVLLIVWSFFVHHVLDPPALAKALFIFSPLILTAITLMIVINRRKLDASQHR